MYTLFVTLIIIAAFLMIGIVLIQESKGGGLASGFSGANSFAGVANTNKFIENVTWALAGFMVVVSIICAYVAPSDAVEGSVIEKAATEQATTNPNNVQGFGAAPQKGAAGAQATDAAPAAQGAQQDAPAAPAK